MKFALLILLSAVSLASCTWTKSDLQRLGTKVLDTAAREAQAIQIQKNTGK